MGLLLIYSFRSLSVRLLTNVLTAGGMGLVVFVCAAVLMLNAGLRQTLVSTGDDANVIFIRRAAEVEIQSMIDRAQARIIESLPEVMIGANGLPLVSKEFVVLATMPQRDSNERSNVVIRGVGPLATIIRPQIRVVEGRMFEPESNEIIIGNSLVGRFQGVDIGSIIRIGQQDWQIVGRFEAGGSGFDSEIWGDNDQFTQSFRRNTYSSVIVRLKDDTNLAYLKNKIEADPRLMLDVKQEKKFYEDQSRILSNFIEILGMTLNVMFSIGAIIGATITMYATVASRKREIGVLRALGFRRINILATFLFESVFLALCGWIFGLAVSYLLTFVEVRTLNWTSLSELAFNFFMTSIIISQTFAFAIGMGVIGGVLPALRASRMKIVDALRSS